MVFAVGLNDLGDFLRRCPASQDNAARAIDRRIHQRIAHSHSRVLIAAFAPCLSKIALQKFWLRHFVAQSLLLVGLEFLREIRQHLWCHPRIKGALVAAAVGQLNLTEELLERVIVLYSDGQRRTSSSASTKAIVHV